jgi:Kef-type K+ transport system membrane component KefB
MQGGKLITLICKIHTNFFIDVLLIWNDRYISEVEMWLVLLVVGLTSVGIEFVGYNGKPVSFLVGLAFPRRGPAARTVLNKLMFPVHYIILPLYFSGVFVTYDFSMLAEKGVGRMVGIAFLVSFICMVGKVAGTVAVTRFFFKMRLKEGVVLGMLLTVKGYMDLVFISIGVHFQVSFS